MVFMGKISVTSFGTLLWILALLCFLSPRRVSMSHTDDEDLAKMRQQWEECCRSNRTLCIRGSCYSVEWRAAAWAAVRNRCRGRYSDWPFAVDIMRIQEEKDIEALWKLLTMANAYPNKNSALPITVWTSGTRCPQRGPSGIVVSTKWASNKPFPSWLEETVNDSSPASDSSSDESCKFMVITPQANRTADFHFEDENAKHAAVCEFLFPDETRWTSSTNTDSTLTSLPYDCTRDSTDASWCHEETGTTLSTDALSSTTNIISTELSIEIETLTPSVTPNLITNEENTSIDGKNALSTTGMSRENGSDIPSQPTANEITESTDIFSDGTSSEITKSHTESTSASDDWSTGRRSTDSSSSQTTTESGTRTDKNDLNSDGCKERNASGIRWPATPPGATANQSCPDGMTGYAQWKCDEETMTFVPEKPSIHQCRHTWIDRLEDEISADGDAVKISSKLANKTNDTTLSHGDIAAVVQLAENLMELFTKQKYEKESQNELHQVPNMTYDFTKSFVATYSNVLRYEHRDAWSDLPQIHQRVVASKILRHTETMGQVLSCIKLTDDNVQYTVLEDNINLQTYMFNSSEKRNIPYVFPELGSGMSSSGEIEIPADLVLDLWPSVCAKVKTAVGIVYKNVGQFLKEESEKKIDSNVSSAVLGFTLGNSSTRSIKMPQGVTVSILLKHTTPLNKRSAAYSVPRCVFWNFSRGSYGDWDDSGCRVAYSDLFSTRCTCDHLTNFAILMDVNNNVGRKDLALEMMTYICCGLSAVGLILTLIFLIGIRSLHCRRSTITSNLCACLLLMNVIMLFGLDRTKNKVLCAVIAGFLQYSVLAGFCWMLMEAYQLYQMVILVFCSSTQISIMYIYMFGYGAPLVIVGISAGIRHEDYGGPDFCWLSNENGLMWSFVGPACFIIMVNLVVFIMTIRSASSVKIRKEQKMADKARGWIKGSFSILCLLGLTWCSGLFYMEKSFYPTAYLFTFLNGLQGIFIFIFHVLLNDKAGSIFRRMFKTKMVRQTTKSTILNGTSSSGHRRQAQGHNVNSINGEVRNSRSLSNQNSRPNSASSNGISSRAGQEATSRRRDSRENSLYLSRTSAASRPIHIDDLRMKSAPLGYSKDVPHSRTRGVVRQVQRAHHGI